MICQTCMRVARRSPVTTAPRQMGSAPARVLSRHFLTTTGPIYSRASSVRLPSSPRTIGPVHNAIRRPFSSSTPLLSATASSEASPISPSTVPEKPDSLTEGEARVWDILVAQFAPTELVVQDISGGCGSMYGIDITSDKFRGLNMLKQQRLVNAALGDLVKEWHGVQLKTRSP